MDTGLSLSGPNGRIEAEALDWFVRRTGGLDAADELAFQAWLQANAAHVTAFAQWQDDWQQFDAAPADLVHQLRTNLAYDKAMVAERASRVTSHDAPRNATHDATHIATPSESSAFMPWMQRALTAFFSPRSVLAGACLSVMFAGVMAWNFWWQPVFSQSYVTARGEQTEVVLPDGSRMQLDTDTRTDVALYRGHRDVELPAGQARFQVKGDAGRPFDVLAGPLRITVVGTRFAVRYTPEIPGHDGVRVAVEEGRVRVARASWFGDKGEVELTAGQQIVSNANGALGVVSNVAVADVAPWRDNRVSFDNMPLQQVVAEFERYGDTHLTIPDPAIAQLRVTGTFDPHHVENFTRVLPYALPVRLSQAGGNTAIVAIK